MNRLELTIRMLEEENRIKELASAARHEEQGIKYTQEEENAAIGFICKCKKATAYDYAKWLKGYLKQEGCNITSVRDSNMPTSLFLLAKEDILLTPLYGSSAKVIIVNDYNITIQDPSESFRGYGHNKVYLKKDGVYSTFSSVPFYKDMRKYFNL